MERCDSSTEQLRQLIVDDANDKFRFGTGYDALNRVIWGPLKNYTFVNGGDDGFGHNPYIRDLDLDGWNDADGRHLSDVLTAVDGAIESLPA